MKAASLDFVGLLNVNSLSKRAMRKLVDTH